MTKRLIFSRFLLNGLTVSGLFGFTSKTAIQPFSLGYTTMAYRQSSSNSANLGTLPKAAMLPFGLILALTCSSAFSAPQAPSATNDRWVDTQLEVGATYNIESKASIMARVQAGYERLSGTAILATIDDKPEFVLASLRYAGDGWAIDAGRIGVSFGMTPPVYSAVVPMASEPDIHPVILRSITRTLGLPDLGGAVTFDKNNFRFRFAAYAPSTENQMDLAALATIGSDVKAQGPVTPDICTICDAVASITGVDLNPVFSSRIQVIETPRTIDDIFTIGFEFNTANWRFVADGAQSKINDETIRAGIVAAEHGGRYGIAGFQVGRLNTSTLASGYIVLDAGDFKPYARAAIIDGTINAEEYGIGVQSTVGRLNLRGGYEWIESQGIKREGVTAAVSVRIK